MKLAGELKGLMVIAASGFSAKKSISDTAIIPIFLTPLLGGALPFHPLIKGRRCLLPAGNAKKEGKEKKIYSNLIAALILFLLGMVSISFAAEPVSAQLFCRLSGNDCIYDSSVSPNPDCSYGSYDPCPSGDYNLCCQLGQPEGNYGPDGILVSCDNVECTTSAGDPGCPNWHICTALDPGTCTSLGGATANCTQSDGSPGNCCQPLSSGCNYGEVCSGLDPGACSAEDGYTANCTTPDGSSGTCCTEASTPDLPDQCDPDWTCINAPQAECDGINGTYTDCSTPYGETGTCCEPPPQTTSACSLAEGICRTPSQQSTPGSCEWNEIELEFGYACESAGYPTGTLCCNPVEGIGECPPGSTSDGVCRDSCASNESAYTGFNECMEFGQECCLLEASSLLDTPIFCDASGRQTTSDATGRLYTAIGCIPITGANDFLEFILPWTLGLAGGIAFLFIIYAGFQIITSAGDPRKLQAGKELLTAAIGGLLLILFSAFLLELIGVDILDIPGFGTI